jgi:cytochrome c biogenesis protein CcdA
MTDPTIPVLGLAVIDSLNPSALAVTLWLLSQPGAVPRVIAYVGGILVAYLVLGIGLMLGLGAAMRAFGDALSHPVALAIQLAIGLGLLGYGIFAPKAGAEPVEPSLPIAGGLAGMALLGMTITAVELVTALPYFAATTLMTSAQWPAVQWLPLLLVYNAIFVAPPMLLLVLHVLLGRRLGDRYARWRTRLQRDAREAMLWIVALAGLALSGDAIDRYIAKHGKRADVQTMTTNQFR